MKKTLLLLLILPLLSQAQIITTVAGCGIGDDSLATAAELYYPHSVAVDTFGNVYIADASNERVRKINTSGIITTIAGTGVYGYSGDGGPATAAQLGYPAGVAVDIAGNVYIGDEENNRIRKVSTSGVISTIAGNGTAAYSGDGGPATAAELYYPMGLSFDTSGNLFFADAYNFRIRKINTAGIITTVAGNGTSGSLGNGGPATAAGIGEPYAVSADAKGNIYIADWSNSLIHMVNSTGTINTIAGTGTFGYNGDGGPATATEINFPNGITVDTAGNVIFSDAHNSRVRKINTSGIINIIAGTGVAGYSGDGGPATDAQFSEPAGLTIDRLGNIYIPDDANNRIRKITTTGTITTIAGRNGLFGEGYTAVNAELGAPWNLATDTAGNVYIADYSNNRIRKYNPGTGTVNTVCGDGISGYYDSYSGDGSPADSAHIYEPTAVAVDAAGNIYVADYGNKRIRKVNTSGIITTIAGTGVAGYTGTGITAASAEINRPNGMAVDGSGNVYFVDYGNYRIREINTLGIIFNVAGNGTAGYSGDGSPATAERLSPSDVAVDATGNIYIADGGNNRVRKVDTAGIITTIAGTGTAGFTGDGGPATAAEINSPGGIKVDGMGNVYIADYSNRIRMIDVYGTINTIAGNGTAGFTGDGGIATLAEINSPAGVAIDNAGNVYIADFYNYRIRKVSSTLGVPSVNKTAAWNVSVYPNPASTSLTVSASVNVTSITITNIVGQTVYTQPYNSPQVQINVSVLSSGIYFLKVNNTVVKKFVKE